MFFYLRKIFSKLSLYTFFLFALLLVIGNFSFPLILFACLFKSLSLTFKNKEEIENNIVLNDENILNNSEKCEYHYCNYPKNISKNRPLVRKRVKKN